MYVLLCSLRLSQNRHSLVKVQCNASATNQGPLPTPGMFGSVVVFAPCLNYDTGLHPYLQLAFPRANNEEFTY